MQELAEILELSIFEIKKVTIKHYKKFSSQSRHFRRDKKEKVIMSKKNNKNKTDNNKFTNKFTGSPVNTYVSSAFEQLRQDFGLDPISKKTTDEAKLQKQVDNFKGKYVCELCGKEKQWIPDTNVMVCTNDMCRGYPIKNKNNEIVGYKPSSSQLNPRGAEIAETLLG